MIPNLQLVSDDKPMPVSIRGIAQGIIAKWNAPLEPGYIRYGIDTREMFFELNDEELLHLLKNTLDEIERRCP